MNYIKVNVDDKNAIKELSILATMIVKEHYDPIVGEIQNNYMIDKFQSASSIEKQLKNGYNYYFVSNISQEKIGFIGYYIRENDLYLSKFYLRKDQRGKGISKEMLNFLINKAKESNKNFIVLNVNKQNNAIFAYEKLGFVKIGAEKNDIGNNYYMDDFIYKYSIK
jgi:ribosomal protein S18 acetylase RimI-like enzyme